MPTLVSSVAPAPGPAPAIDHHDPWRLAVPPSLRLLVLAAAVAVVGDQALQVGVAGSAGAATVVAASAALLRSGRLERTTARLLVAAAPVFGVWLAIRTSPWLLPLDVLAAVGLLVLGAGFARGGSLGDLPPIALLRRIGIAAGHVVWAPAMVRLPRSERPAGRAAHVRAVARGAAIAVPIVLVLGGLLASADVVFATVLGFGFQGEQLVAHGAGLLVAGWGALGLLRIASAPAADDADRPRPSPRWLGRTEVTIVLGAVAVLFAGFVATQLLIALGGADHVLETAGLTRAEYARSGFFQLLWVAGLTISGLVALAHLTELAGARRALAGAVVAFAVAIVGVAIVRLDLYRDAYGWTMLRLACTAFAAWLGVVLVLLGVALAGPAPVRRLGWFVPAAGAAGLAILLALNVANPEAMVARYNLTREASVAVDTDYLDHLSDDAVPTIVGLLPDLDPATARAVRIELRCDGYGSGGGEERGDGWTAWNLGRDRAREARRDLCEGLEAASAG